ncbi:MAG: hypothetical protein MMC23_008897 [Stictis urceolatum]|nr:hypothetical protein [Stictis urceolata]
MSPPSTPPIGDTSNHSQWYGPEIVPDGPPESMIYRVIYFLLRICLALAEALPAPRSSIARPSASQSDSTRPISTQFCVDQASASQQDASQLAVTQPDIPQQTALRTMPPRPTPYHPKSSQSDVPEPNADESKTLSIGSQKDITALAIPSPNTHWSSISERCSSAQDFLAALEPSVLQPAVVHPDISQPDVSLQDSSQPATAQPTAQQEDPK